MTVSVRKGAAGFSPRTKKSDVLHKLAVGERVLEFTFNTIGIVNHYRTAIAWVLGFNRHRENTGEPWHHGIPDPSTDQHKMIRDVSLPQILRDRDDDP